jgi:glycosyltransferase involved in cell wall biosynthesis
MPTVSVVMVFHRVNPFMAEAIRSVVNQDYHDWELILVDNGTGVGADALGDAAGDPRVRFVRLPSNQGIPAGHNAGVAAAQGEFVALHDYDDVSLPDRLRLQVAALLEDPGLAVVSALAERIDEKNQLLRGPVFCLPDANEHRAYALYAPPVITPVAMARREVFRTLPYRAEFPFAADIDFQARVVDNWRMAVLPRVLLRYREYAAQTTQQRAVSIERSRAVIQLITARRRTSCTEDLSSALHAVDVESAAESWRCTSALCAREGFAVLAAFHARRSLVLDRTCASVVKAVQLMWCGLRGRPVEEQKAAWQMFLKGPVKALKLRPA